MKEIKITGDTKINIGDIIHLGGRYKSVKLEVVNVTNNSNSGPVLTLVNMTKNYVKEPFERTQSVFMGEKLTRKEIEVVEIPLWRQELEKVNQLPQTQEALNDQLAKLRVIANKFGLYDAADYLRIDN